jgi:hypothetical protein
MKQKGILLFIFLLFLNFAFSQSLIPFKKNGKWGFCDNDKKVLIPNIYDSAYPACVIDSRKELAWDIVNEYSNRNFQPGDFRIAKLKSKLFLIDIDANIYSYDSLIEKSKKKTNYEKDAGPSSLYPNDYIISSNNNTKKVKYQIKEINKQFELIQHIYDDRGYRKLDVLLNEKYKVRFFDKIILNIPCKEACFIDVKEVHLGNVFGIFKSNKKFLIAQQQSINDETEIEYDWTFGNSYDSIMLIPEQNILDNKINKCAIAIELGKKKIIGVNKIVDYTFKENFEDIKIVYGYIFIKQKSKWSCYKTEEIYLPEKVEIRFTKTNNYFYDEIFIDYKFEDLSEKLFKVRRKNNIFYINEKGEEFVSY